MALRTLRGWSWRLIGTTIVIGMAGLVLLLLPAATNNEGWASGVLINFGTSLVLFVPLLVIGKFFEKRLTARQDASDSKVADLGREVSGARAEIRSLREQLAESVAADTSEVHSADMDLFRRVEAEPSVEVVHDALLRAYKLSLVAGWGPRVTLPGTRYFIRFRANQPPNDNGIVNMPFEDLKGNSDTSFTGSSEGGMKRALIAMRTKLQEINEYPGDTRFEPTEIFASLSRLLTVSYEHFSRGEPIGGVVQLFEPTWALTTEAIVRYDASPRIEIPVSRIDDVDWVCATLEAEGLDPRSIASALEAAREMSTANNLW